MLILRFRLAPTFSESGANVSHPALSLLLRQSFLLADAAMLVEASESFCDLKFRSSGYKLVIVEELLCSWEPKRGLTLGILNDVVIVEK